MVLKKSEQRDYEDVEETDTDTLLKDQELGGRRPYPSDVMPEDYYQYKRFVNLPESQSEFEGLIDKDVVFANLKGSAPNIEELSFQSGTIQWTKELFTVETRVFININDPSRFTFNKDEIPEHELSDYVEKKTNIIDPDALPILKVLTNRFKFGIVSSRAIGDTRAGMLDTMTQTRISKELTRNRKESEKKFGLGGN